MTTEQLNELADALLVLSAKSSVLKERDELRALMEENQQVEEVCMVKVFLVGRKYDSA
jgi:LETM1 and EF-hand domain-containing protein 1